MISFKDVFRGDISGLVVETPFTQVDDGRGGNDFWVAFAEITEYVKRYEKRYNMSNAFCGTSMAMILSSVLGSFGGDIRTDHRRKSVIANLPAWSGRSPDDVIQRLARAEFRKDAELHVMR